MKIKCIVGLALLILVGCAAPKKTLPIPPRMVTVPRVSVKSLTTGQTVSLRPVYRGTKHVGFAAYWTTSDISDMWRAEWSSDLLWWHIEVPFYIEPGPDWVSQWFVRLRKL